MFETFVITFREGLEAFLVVAIMLAYLSKFGESQHKQAVYWGIATALLISVTTAWHVADLAANPIWEGTLALIAGLLVASFTLYVMKTAKYIRSDIHTRLDKHLRNGGLFALSGIFIFTVLMIAREGMETALLLGTLSAKESISNLAIGTALGLGSVAIIGALWVSQSARINLKLFLQVTGIFLVLFAINLFIYGIHELGEMNAIPMIGESLNNELHIYTEPFGHDSLYAQLINLGLLIVPSTWLLWAFLQDKFLQSSSHAGAK